MVNNVETPSQMQSADAVADGRSAGQELQLLPQYRDKSNGLSCSLATTKQHVAWVSRKQSCSKLAAMSGRPMRW
jgi:hypothetical protein